MPLVKRVLLGSAAGLLTVAAAQAADLPVKAKPVEYVKVCSLYGAGFWYVPGTDTCIKLGSYLRFQMEENAGDGGIPIGAGGTQTGGGVQTRNISNMDYRYRFHLSTDIRTQTEYGTLRSYADVGTQATSSTVWGGSSAAFNSSVANNNVDVERAFIQFAGLTAGRIRSFFDINSLGPYSLGNSRMAGDSAPSGYVGVGYTWQFGNGISASLALQDGGSLTGPGRSTSNLAANGFGGTLLGAGQTVDNRGTQFMDPVMALRIDQAWGYAAATAVLHDNSGGYYAGNGLGAGGGNGAGVAGCQANSLACGHPDDKWGWAAAFGFTLNNVFGLAGDTFGAQFNFGIGAMGYVSNGKGTWLAVGSGNSLAYANTPDAVFVNGSGIEQTTAWNVTSFYEHRWSPQWRTDLWGGYTAVSYDSTAKNMICAGAPGFAATGGSLGFLSGAWTAGSSCNPDASWAQIGSRTMWNPHPDLDIGVEVLYTQLDQKNSGGMAFTAAQTGTTGLTGGVYNFANQGIWSGFIRVQRNFLY